jgi:hypothetical protein
MNYSNLNTFANRFFDTTDTSDIRPVRNPVVKYAKVARDGAMSAPDRAQEAKRQEKRQPAAAPGVQAPGSGSIAKQAVEDNAFSFDLSDRGLLNSFIMSEVLGRPKCLRQGRRPYGR